MTRSADATWRLAGAVAVGVLVLDQVTKTVVARTMTLHETIPLLPVFALTYVRNTGAAFGILAAAPAGLRVPVLLGVTVIAIAALVSFLRRTPAEQPWLAAALGGILGGALGNLVCRLRFGEVVDFLLLHWGDLQWPAFNVADSAITVGVAIVLVASLRAPGDHVAGRGGGRA
jgi:signal peptidase II